MSSTDPASESSEDTPQTGGVVVLPAAPLHVGWPRRSADFIRRVYHKSAEDNVFFMAGAISFNVVVAVVPLLLFAVGIAGLALSAGFADPTDAVLDRLLEVLPAIEGDIDLVQTVRRQVGSILDGSAGLTVVSAILLVWFSTRLVGTLRTALREIFDIGQPRGIIRGKIFDVQVVVIGGLLFSLNLGVTAVVTAASALGIDILGLEGAAVSFVERSVATLVAFGSIWLLLLGTYRFLPARRIPWRTAFIAATFAAILHELLKFGFGWYATGVADYRSAYGNLVTAAVLFIWIYYEAIMFVVCGEIAQIWTMRRARRVKTRSALFGP